MSGTIVHCDICDKDVQYDWHLERTKCGHIGPLKIVIDKDGKFQIG